MRRFATQAFQKYSYPSYRVLADINAHLSKLYSRCTGSSAGYKEQDPPMPFTPTHAIACVRMKQEDAPPATKLMR